MGRSTSEGVTYPSLAINRDIYFTYMSDKNRPKPATLLEFAMCAYMKVESGQEATMHSLLEMKRQLTKVFDEQKVAQELALQEIQRAELAEKEMKEKKIRLIVNECFLMCGVKTPPFREPKDVKEIRYNERVCDAVRNRLWERYQLQSSNFPDDRIIDLWFDLRGEVSENED